MCGAFAKLGFICHVNLECHSGKFWKFPCEVIYGQESPGWISVYKLGTFFFFLKKSRDLNLFGKNDWSMNSGRGRAGER